jgi:hypothetical protein
VPSGYHRLRVSIAGGLIAGGAVVMAPAQCFEPPALAAGRRLWGVAVQLYTLRSPRNWGIGDFDDLATVIHGCAAHGADFVGLNPLHALFAADPARFSPYSPSSRHFLNVFNIAVPSVDGFYGRRGAERGWPHEFRESLERLATDRPGRLRGCRRVKPACCGSCSGSSASGSRALIAARAGLPSLPSRAWPATRASRTA